MNKEPKRRPTRKVTKKTEINGNKGGLAASEEEWDDNYSIRCPCGDNVDKGLMIQCETCLVWQHSNCVGIREDKAVPAHYFCEICLPRNFKCTCGENTAIGKFVQCGECLTWQHIRCLGKGTTAFGKSYRCSTCSPQDFVPNTRIVKRKETKKMANQPKDFSFISSDNLRELFEKDLSFLSTTKEKENADKVEHLLPSKQEVMEKYCIKLCDAQDENKMEPYEVLKGLGILLDCNIENAKEWLEEILQDLIDRRIASKEIPSPMEGWTHLTENIYNNVSESTDPSETKFDVRSIWGDDLSGALEVSKMNNQWGLILTKATTTDQFITEFLGKVAFMKDWDYNNLPNDEKSLLLRTNRSMKESPMCIDARNCGNKARFIRRSCAPNAFVKYTENGTQIHAGIFAKENIDSNTEITIDFDSDWADSKHPLQCVCHSEDCKVVAWFKNRQSQASRILSDVKSLSLSSDTDESEEEEEVKRKPVKRRKPALSPIQIDKNKEDEPEVIHTPTEKMSREERKIAMLMKSFQRMEHRQNRKRKSTEEKRPKKILPKRKKELHLNGNVDHSGNDVDDSYSDGDKNYTEEEKYVPKSEKGFSPKAEKPPKREKPNTPKADKPTALKTTIVTPATTTPVKLDKPTTPKTEKSIPIISPPSSSSPSSSKVEKPNTKVVDKNDVELKNEPNDKTLPSSLKSDEKPLVWSPEIPISSSSSSETNVETYGHNSPRSTTTSSHKFGKKAWIKEFSQETGGPEKAEESVNKFPVKKKMLGSFLTESSENDKTNSLLEKKEMISPSDAHTSASETINNQQPPIRLSSPSIDPASMSLDTSSSSSNQPNKDHFTKAFKQSGSRTNGEGLTTDEVVDFDMDIDDNEVERNNILEVNGKRYSQSGFIHQSTTTTPPNNHHHHHHHSLQSNNK